MTAPANMSSLIQAAGHGDRSAFDHVWLELCGQLHEIAARQLSSEHSGHLLQTTAVVNEAWFRLSKSERSEWNDRRSFLSAAANAMRRVLIDNARRERAVRRGGGATGVPLTDTRLAFDDRTFDALEIHEALQKLAEFAAEAAHALELMIYGGLTLADAAEVMGVSESTVSRKIRTGKAWLRRELSEGV